MTGHRMPELSGDGLVRLAEAALTRPSTTPPSRRIPSLYADPTSWSVLAAVDEAWARCPAGVRAAPEATGMVLVSAHGTTATMTAIARAVPGGRLSPLRFAGASAGGPVSLVCLVHGFRGPTLVITAEPDEGHPAALTVARHWLRTGAAGHVVAGLHQHDPHGHQVRCVVLGAQP
ncbi:hypothetical protein [Actinoplanes sp. M2I2]|uniref:hypothetical protein n=1 Tax=Actinoplanes sp. M2I2 TaxID=1734444 RepID=UPI002022892D|nr:hypothetical protein [Actinoplanes sp. M2I2]